MVPYAPFFTAAPACRSAFINDYLKDFTDMAQQSLEKSKIKFLLLEGVHPSAVTTLQKAGYSNIEQHTESPAARRSSKRPSPAPTSWVFARAPSSPKTYLRQLTSWWRWVAFASAPTRWICRLPRNAAVVVFNAPFSNTRSVAELVLAEAILLLRGVAAKNAAAHRGEWQKSAANAFEIRGKKLGIIGYGNIGMQLGVIAEGLGMQVQFYDVTNKLPLGNARQVPSLEPSAG